MMKTYITKRTFYQRNKKNGYYIMMDCIISSVHANKETATIETQKSLDWFHNQHGGVETVHSNFGNEVYNHTIEMGDCKMTFIVTENEVIE